MVDPRLQELLICPACHGELAYEEHAILCSSCGARYGLDGQIPLMLTGLSNDGFGHDLYHAQLHGNFFERVFHSNRIATLTRLIASELAVPAGARALDVGCNTGPMVIPLRRRGYDVVGVDISPGDVRQAANYLGAQDLPGDRLLVADGTCMPFRDGGFDLILLIDVLEHTEDPQRMVAETLRLLAPGGVVVATVPWARHPYVRYTWLRKALSSRKTIDEHPDAPFSLEMLQDLFPADFEPLHFRLVFHWVCILGVYRLSGEGGEW